MTKKRNNHHSYWYRTKSKGSIISRCRP